MTTEAFHIRRLHQGDASALATLFTDFAVDEEIGRFFQPHPMTTEYALELCAGLEHRKDRYYGLWLDEKLVGYMMLRGWDEGYAVPSVGIGVHPRARNVGAGQALMRHAIRESREAGAEKLRLTVSKGNARGIHSHLKHGFVLVDRDEESFLGLLDLTTTGASA